MADENIEIGVAVKGEAAVDGVEQITDAVDELKEGVEGLDESEATLAAFDEAVKNLADSFADSDPVFGKALETLGSLATGDYFSAIANGFEMVGAAMEEHEKYVESVNAAYEKLQTRIDPNGEFAQTLKALKGTLESAQAEGGSMESILAERMEKIVEAKKQAAIREQSGDGVYGAMSGWAGRNSGIVGEGMGLNKNLEAQSQEDVEHRKLLAQADRDMAERDRLAKLAAEEEAAWAKIADAKDRKEVESQAKFEQHNRQVGEKQAAEAAKREDDAAMAVGRRALDEKLAKDKEEEKEYAKLDKLGEKRNSKEESWDRSQAMKAITDQKKNSFEGGMDTSYDSLYNRFAKAGSASGKSAEEIAKEQDALRKEWHDQDMAKIDKQIELQQQTIDKLGLK